MSKKIYIASGIGILVIAGAAGGWYWQGRTSESTQKVASSGSSSQSQTLGSSSDSNSVPLNRSPGQNNSSGGLSVDQNTQAANLGQLYGDNSNQTGGSSSGSGAKKQTSPFDPTTFKQYDKYVAEKAGLFGDVQPGTGAELTAGKKAVVYYKGWLTDGQLFDQSKPNEKGELQAFAFTLGAHQVIPGWEQALAGMKVGGVRLVIVPPAVGYGAAGQGPIPGNSVLIFQVQLAAVE